MASNARVTFAADLHLHSRYARGVSPALDLTTLAEGAAAKGVDLLAASDFTHPAWLAELERGLAPVGDTGLFSLRSGEAAPMTGARFVLGTEVSCVYRQAERGRRVHLLLFAPDFDVVHRLCALFAPYGALASDGRPTLSLSARDAVEAALDADPRCIVIPAHVWTPWYSVYGAKGGFDSLQECFGDLLPHVPAIETGLSSDPAMNWRVPELDTKAIVSFSDAHSAPRIGREVTIFDEELSYDGLRRALLRQSIAYTVEFFPEEGKYHLDGHRKCGIRQAPEITLRDDGRCRACGRLLTIGVAHRVERLAQRPHAVERGAEGWLRDPQSKRPPFKRLVSLRQVIAEAIGKGTASKAAAGIHAAAISRLGPELPMLLDAPLAAIAEAAGERVAEGVGRVRQGNLAITPGYDGEYGAVRIWGIG